MKGSGVRSHRLQQRRCVLMQPKQRVSTPQGRVARHFGCQRVAAIEFLCAGRAMRRKVTPSSLGIRGMSVHRYEAFRRLPRPWRCAVMGCGARNGRPCQRAATANNGAAGTRQNRARPQDPARAHGRARGHRRCRPVPGERHVAHVHPDRTRRRWRRSDQHDIPYEEYFVCAQ
jgi:hypothetical protein